MLDSSTFDATEKAVLGNAASEKPMELVMLYDPQFKSSSPGLEQRLRTFDPHETIYRRHFRNARHAGAELGPCASDLIWRRALKELEARAQPVYDEDDNPHTDSDIAIAKARLGIRDVVKNWVFPMPNLDPTSLSFNVSPQFSKLIQILKACEAEGESFRGIVFVQRRCVAFALADMLRMLDDHVTFLRPHVIVGDGLVSESSAQDGILDGFKAGTYNLLVATKAAEDLDISPCTIVIRYDLFDSQVSNAYCRSRTRGRESHLVHMAERGSDVHRRILSQIARRDPQMEGWMQKVASSPSSGVPPCTLNETIDPYRSDSDDEGDDPSKFIQDPTTSGRIYRQDATTVVYRFVSQLQICLDTSVGGPLFEVKQVTSDKPTYVCTVLLPSNAPIGRVCGSPSSTVSQARRSACYRTCMELFQKGLLDYMLFPRPPLPTLRRQRTAYISCNVEEELSDKDDDETFLPAKATKGQSKSAGTRTYPRKTPDFWPNSLQIMRGTLYPTIVTPIVTGDILVEGPYAPMVILTRLPLPPVAGFKLFFSGIAGSVHLTRGAAFEVDEDRFQDLYQYTMRLCRSVANKPFICRRENMAYFLAPLSVLWSPPNDHGTARWSFPNVVEHVAWDKLHLAAVQGLVPLRSQSAETLAEDAKDAIIQDRWIEFTRRYYCVRIRPDLDPTSKPEDSPRERNYENLLEYCKARRKGFEGLKDQKQPLIEVSRVPAVINHLNPTSQPFPEGKRHPAKYLFPELCAKLAIPASTFRTALLLPSILRRLDDILLVKELNAKFFDHTIAEHHLHAAISAPSAAVDVDYERLELLGDAYLKYLASIYLFVTNPSHLEGPLHTARQRIISNRSLLRNADRTGLPQYIQSRSFTSKFWAPPNFAVEQAANAASPKGTADLNVEDGELVDECQDLAKQGKKSRKKRRRKDENVQWISDKGVADVAEAIIGAAYLTGGREIALKITKAINIPVPHIDRWSDFGRKALAPPPEITANLKIGSVEAIEQIIGHKFERPHLLAQALTHASIQGHEMTSYERLEFIGDAILDFLVIRHIFDRHATLSPGALTLLKAAMVSNSALGAVCISVGLHEHMLFESQSLATSIQSYANQLHHKKIEEYELATREGRSPGQYWVHLEPPKALSDVVESIMGSVYVSDNFSPIGAETFFNKVLKPFFDRHITLQTLSHHPTKILFELLQSHGCHDFEISKEMVEGNSCNMVQCDVIVHDIILARASDISSITASRMASFGALNALEGDADFLKRTCKCHAITEARKANRKTSLQPGPDAMDVEVMAVEFALRSDAEEQRMEVAV